MRKTQRPGVAVTVVVTSYALSITWLVLPLLVGAAWIVRGCAQVERKRGLLVAEEVPDTYRAVTKPGLFAQIKTRWTDPATLRDCAYLVGDVSATAGAGHRHTGPLAELPRRARAAAVVLVHPQEWPNGVRDHGVMIGYLPNGPHGDGGFGVWIGDLPTALIPAAVFFLLSSPPHGCRGEGSRAV